MALVCGCLTQENVEEMVEKSKESNADILEARLDFLTDPKKLEGLKKIGKPLITSCMPIWEGGFFKGTEEERIKILESTLGFTDYITIELNTEKKILKKLVEKAKQNNVKVIISFHDFEKTPTEQELEDILKEEFSQNADIAKIACMPNSSSDVGKIIRIQSKQKKDKTILLSMGELGRISRVAGPALGAFLTYGSIGRPSGAGQLSVKSLKEVISKIGKQKNEDC